MSRKPFFWAHKKWTPEEEEMLKTHYSIKTQEELSQIFIKHDQHSIRGKARRMGLKKSADTLSFIKRRAGAKRKPDLKEIGCTICEKTMMRPPSQINMHNFCSPEHHREWQRGGGKRISVCFYCGIEFKRKPSRTKKSKKHFCGRACLNRYRGEFNTGENNPSWDGGCVGYYGSNWRPQRIKALERDGYICRKCNKFEVEKTPSVHHIKPFKEFGIERYKDANSLENLISLCNKCHQHVEHRHMRFDGAR